MDNKITYHEQNDIDNTLKLREVLKTLPPFCRDYFRAIDATTTTKTRISYAYDIRIFFQFLLEQNPMFKDKTMSDFTKFINPRTLPKRKQMVNVASNVKFLL